MARRSRSGTGAGAPAAGAAITRLRRGDTQHLIVFRSRRREVDPETLRRVLRAPVQSVLKAVCRWGARLGDGWDIGDYRFLILEFRSGDAVLYVQFWSEPAEFVHMEVSSGRANPPAHHLVGAVQRKKLRELGFRVGGGAKNYEKDIPNGDERFTALAEETVHILVDVLGYRGLTPLKAQLHADTRAEMVAVHASVTPEEVGKLLVASHFDVGAPTGDEAARRMRVIAGDREVDVHLTHQVRGQNLYRRVSVTLSDSVTPLGVVDLDGGVTTRHLHRRLVSIITDPLTASATLLVAGPTTH